MVVVVVDKYIPYLSEWLRPFAEVIALPPELITATAVRDADALVIRTRTRCDASLLEGSRVRFIATATIGYDHIDTDYCDAHHIRWTNCPGCNAQGVCDYVEEALRTLEQMDHLSPSSLTLGIIGVGHVGEKVAMMALRRGYRVLLNDPIREQHNDPCPIGSWETVETLQREADILTFHTPLTTSGEFSTFHLCDTAFLSRCRKGVKIIHCSRGEVADTEALISARKTEHISRLVIDTWEHEPDIDTTLLELADLASFHIAGYTAEGKMNASRQCFEQLSHFFSLNICKNGYFCVPLQANWGDTAPGWLSRITESMKKFPMDFESLRKNYKLR